MWRCDALMHAQSPAVIIVVSLGVFDRGADRHVGWCAGVQCLIRMELGMGRWVTLWQVRKPALGM